ncbi:hypothetical protein B0H12DRAFT_1240362 [Mycena haematopus]|nr:hypothetical protein B0H12DRAFT_1240362 [Mycena haematopus]
MSSHQLTTLFQAPGPWLHTATAKLGSREPPSQEELTKILLKNYTWLERDQGSKLVSAVLSHSRDIVTKLSYLNQKTLGHRLGVFEEAGSGVTNNFINAAINKGFPPLLAFDAFLHAGSPESSAKSFPRAPVRPSTTHSEHFRSRSDWTTILVTAHKIYLKAMEVASQPHTDLDSVEDAKKREQLARLEVLNDKHIPGSTAAYNIAQVVFLLQAMIEGQCVLSKDDVIRLAHRRIVTYDPESSITEHDVRGIIRNPNADGMPAAIAVAAVFSPLYLLTDINYASKTYNPGTTVVNMWQARGNIHHVQVDHPLAKIDRLLWALMFEAAITHKPEDVIFKFFTSPDIISLVTYLNAPDPSGLPAILPVHLDALRFPSDALKDLQPLDDENPPLDDSTSDLPEGGSGGRAASGVSGRASGASGHASSSSRTEAEPTANSRQATPPGEEEHVDDAEAEIRKDAARKEDARAAKSVLAARREERGLREAQRLREEEEVRLALEEKVKARKAQELAAKLQAEPATKGQPARAKPVSVSADISTAHPKKRKQPSSSVETAPKKKPRVLRDNTLPESLEEVLANPPERSATTIQLGAYCPNGSTASFIWRGHVNSEKEERDMLDSLVISMKEQNKLCTDGDQPRPRFRHHVDGVLPAAPPPTNESDLYVMSLAQWNTCRPEERVAIFGTGCDIFVEGLVPNDLLSPLDTLRLRHPLDAVMQVQVPGLRNPQKETDYTKCIRTTTLRTFLEQANSKDGLVLNCLQLPESHTPTNNLLVHASQGTYVIGVAPPAADDDSMAPKETLTTASEAIS